MKKMPSEVWLRERALKIRSSFCAACVHTPNCTEFLLILEGNLLSNWLLGEHLIRNIYHMYTHNCFFVFALHLELYKSQENKYLISKMFISLFFFIWLQSDEKRFFEIEAMARGLLIACKQKQKRGTGNI